jgi:V/A-type H+-transporting ATPase subunit A
MGYHVLLLADSTSRWAQAMRETSGRLEEIPGEEAFPAYLDSAIRSVYERAGVFRTGDGNEGSLTLIGTVSPAGGNFEEPVTQGTLKVVGAFHGLSRARSDARRYPAIDPLDSWSKYRGIIDPDEVAEVRALLMRGSEIRQMMTVVGEEGTSVEDFTVHLKSEFFDNVYLQQNAFDEVDGATNAERQAYVFAKCLAVLRLDFEFESREQARQVIFAVTDLFRNWNYAAWDSEEFRELEGKIDEAIAAKGAGAEEGAEAGAAGE